MTPDQAAKILDGAEYRDECSRDFEATLKANGLVAVFGASDDLMEFRGAVHDEIDCYDGGFAYFTKSGLLRNDCDSDECPHFARAQNAATAIRAYWAVDDFSWKYESEIPHAKFIVKEGDENYCEGIVFALSDVPSPVSLNEEVEPSHV